MSRQAKWMSKILPDHYTCEPRENGVHCHSEIGIQDEFPAGTGGDDHWYIINKAIKQKFGDRFMEVFEQTSTRHKKFTVYIK